RRAEAERRRSRRPARPGQGERAAEALEGREGGARELPAGIEGTAAREGVLLMPDRPRYMISVAAELVGMHPQTLRMYEARRLMRPSRTPGGTRLYSDNDLERLRLIQRLTTELGPNPAGAERVLRLMAQLRRQ